MPTVHLRRRLHVALHLAMAGLMAGAMVGGHSNLRVLAGAAALLALAIGLSPLARRDGVVRGHVLDCFAMGVGLVASIAGSPMDGAAATHAHAGAAPLSLVAPLALVAAGWAAARVALVLAARTGRRASLAGAAVTAAGFALMLAMA
jgi:hypothetical protein